MFDRGTGGDAAMRAEADAQTAGSSHRHQHSLGTHRAWYLRIFPSRFCMIVAICVSSGKGSVGGMVVCARACGPAMDGQSSPELKETEQSRGDRGAKGAPK